MSTTISTPTTDQPTAETVRTEAEQNLWVALRAHPNNTSAFLSGAAEIGRSTASKILARWASDGTVTRTPGIAEGGQRAADLWAIPTSEDAAADDSAPDNDGPADPTEGADETAEATATDPGPADTDPGEATASGDATDEADTDTPPADPAPEQPAAEPSDAVSGDGEKGRRLASGVLRGLVEDYLRDHPGEFSPHVIARALGGKSAGAVNNALERLTAAGTVVKSSEKPKKFTLARSELDTIREAATG